MNSVASDYSRKLRTYEKEVGACCSTGCWLFTAGLFLLIAATLPAQTNDLSASASAQELKRLSIEELMNVEVTSVSRQPEPLFTSPSAIQVITGEDIRRSGASTPP